MAEPGDLDNEPVTLEDARTIARVDGELENNLLAGWIVTGRRWVEKYTGHVLVRREVTETFDAFGALRLKAWPVAADAAVTIEYIDSAGAAQPLASYRLAVGTRPARLLPAIGSAWPYAPARPGLVTATFQAGYASPADVPAEMKTAILVIVKGLYEDRQLTEEVERAAARLCREYRRRGV